MAKAIAARSSPSEGHDNMNSQKEWPAIAEVPGSSSHQLLMGGRIAGEMP